MVEPCEPVVADAPSCARRQGYLYEGGLEQLSWLETELLSRGRTSLQVGYTLRDDRAGAVLGLWILERALRSCAALFVMVRFGATSFVAAAIFRLLVEGYACTARVGRIECL